MKHHGGARKGAGRPKGQGKYKEPTKAVRLPVSIIQQIDAFIQQTYKLPLYSCKVRAGLPSPAEDHVTERLDLNEYLIRHPASTFLVRVSGNSMINVGIFENDILIVDRSLAPAHGKIVIVAIDGELTVKRLHKKENNKYILRAENPDYPDIEVQESQNTFIWGIVTQVLHAV